MIWFSAKVEGVMWNLKSSGRMSSVGAKFCLEEQDELDADFSKRLSTARGLGFGLGDLSNKEMRIPKMVRKNMTATVVDVMKMRCLIMMWVSLRVLIVLIQT